MSNFTHSDDAGATGGDYVGQSTTSTGGKFVLLKVPNFNESSSNPMCSYLRLGAVPPTLSTQLAAATRATTPTSFPTDSGEDLALKVKSFNDDERYRGGASTDPYYSMTIEQRQDETALLHTRGGWRDHSDGNRITTTRGDKVEVVRGNYKLLVLGREQGSKAEGSADERGGGLAEGGDDAPGSLTQITWMKNELSGTWRVTEETYKGDQISKYYGIVKEQFFGPTLESTTGSEFPTDKLPRSPADPDPNAAAKKVKVCPTCGYANKAAGPTKAAGSVTLAFARVAGDGPAVRDRNGRTTRTCGPRPAGCPDSYTWGVGQLVVVASNGLRFRNTAKVSISGYDDYYKGHKKYCDGDTSTDSTPPSVTVAVQAEEAGVGYNVDSVQGILPPKVAIVASVVTGWRTTPGADGTYGANCGGCNQALPSGTVATAPYDPLLGWADLPGLTEAEATDTQKNPVIVEKLWADSVTSTTGSEICPVPTISESTWATSMTSYTGSEGHPVSTINESLWATTITEAVTADNITSTTTVSGKIMNTETFASYVGKKTGAAQEVWFGSFGELFMGAAGSFRMGISAEISIGKAAEIFIGAATEVFIGSKTEISLGKKTEIDQMKDSWGAFFTKTHLGETAKALFTKQNALSILIG